MKKVFALMMAVLMVAAMFTGCGSSGSKGTAGVIKIGLTGPLTGGAAVYGTAVEAGMKIAVEEINAAAGDNGLKIEFKAADDEHDTHDGSPWLPSDRHLPRNRQDADQGCHPRCYQRSEGSR